MSFTLKLEGADELIEKLQQFTPVRASTMLAYSFRPPMRLIRKAIVQNLSGDVLTPRTKNTLRAFRAVKPLKVPPKRRGVRFVMGLPLPTRDSLGIDPNDPYYYPMALEYGTENIPAKRFIRGAIDRVREEVTSQIASLLRSRIYRALSGGKRGK